MPMISFLDSRCRLAFPPGLANCAAYQPPGPSAPSAGMPADEAR